MQTTWTNWSGSVTCHPNTIETPNSEEELQALVKEACAAKQTVRVVGTGHSFVPLCASDGLLLSLDNLQGVTDANQQDLWAVAWGGTKIYQLGELLHKNDGMAMANMGDIDRQSIAGAVSTGTHGTGRTKGSISTQLRSIHLIQPNGEVRRIDQAEEPERFRAAQVSLGALGVISQVGLNLLPTYRLHERTWGEPFEECMAHLDELVENNQHFEFFWVPEHDICAIKTLNPTEETELLEPAATPNVDGRLNKYIGKERIDYSHRIFPSERNNKFNEIEFAVAAKHGPDCLHEMRQLMQTKYADVVWPIEYRTVAADDIYLSPAYGRATITLSLHQGAGLPYEAFFADVEAIFRNYNGRPHWGKMHSHTATELRDLYPKWDAFLAVREEFDPDGCFLNDYLKRIFGL
ncbi:MAG: D-arabinono-1,4-lactone oxidase [Pseudomonadota bacterium]